jgi:hypothetical protein
MQMLTRIQVTEPVQPGNPASDPDALMESTAAGNHVGRVADDLPMFSMC